VFFLAVLVVAMFGGGVTRVVLVLGLLAWPPTARTTRAMYLSLREVEFVEASQALGFRTLHVMFREILPNAIAPIIVLMSLGVAQAVVIEASLGFVGLTDPSIISWGKMLSDAQDYLSVAWWVSVVPGAGIFLLVMGVNLVGDGINDALGAQSRR
jgi:peptide/nickel transport system permease protein